jgi:hypothetical protein
VFGEGDVLRRVGGCTQGRYANFSGLAGVGKGILRRRGDGRVLSNFFRFLPLLRFVRVRRPIPKGDADLCGGNAEAGSDNPLCWAVAIGARSGGRYEWHPYGGRRLNADFELVF